MTGQQYAISIEGDKQGLYTTAQLAKAYEEGYTRAKQEAKEIFTEFIKSAWSVEVSALDKAEAFLKE